MRMCIQKQWALPVMAWTALMLTSDAARGQWTNAALLNLGSESPQGAIKKPDVCRAAAGGFHIVYRHHLPGGVPMKYRRYLGGLGGMVVAANVPNYAWDEYICEAGNGDIHITWENWDSTPNTGWTRSTNGGTSFQPYIELTSFPASAKAPRIAPVGAANSPDVMLVVANPDERRIYTNRFNGTTWSGQANTGISYATEYQVFGICRSPLDGSIWAGNDSGDETVTVINNAFGPWTSTQVANPGFFARQSVAVNEGGQVMVCWEYNSTWSSRIYTPGIGWGSIQVVDGAGGFGAVVAVPGTNWFYSVYSQGGSGPVRIRGRLHSNGAWGPAEVISGGLPDAQALDPRVAIATDRTLLCCWEWWGNGNAEAWYSVRSALGAPTTGTLAGTVKDQYGASLSYASIVTTNGGAGGSNASGTFSFASPVGTSNVTASRQFYTPHTISGVSVSNGSTTNLDFVLSGQAPADVSSLAITPGVEKNTLNWTNPGSPQLTATRIVYKTTGFPTSPTDGTVLIEDAAAPGSPRSTVHTGLTNGVTYYYRAYTYFQDVSRFYAGGVNGSATPAIRADFDRDGDVDLSDFAVLQRCLSGTSVPPTAPCTLADLDAVPDSDVDNTDVNLFLGCLSGPDVYAAPTCLP